MFNPLTLLKSSALVAALALAAGCQTSPPPGPKESSSAAHKAGVPGGIFVNTIEYTGKIAQIDRTNRKVTIVRSDNTRSTVTVGPEVRNLDKIFEGDSVKLTVTERTVVRVYDGAAPGPDGAAAVVAVAPKGGEPGAIAATATQVTGTVTAIDQQTRKATIQFDDGSSQTFTVRSDIDLTKQKVGSKVVFQVTDMMALSIERQ